MERPACSLCLRTVGDSGTHAIRLRVEAIYYEYATDRGVIRLLYGGPWSSQLQLSEDPEIADLAMRRILATGRCRWQNIASPPLALGPGRPGRFSWQIGGDGRQTVGVALDDPSAVVLPSASPWYVLPGDHLAGPVELDLAHTSRFVQLTVIPDPCEWVCWAKQNEIEPNVIRYAETDPTIFDPPVSNPRSWAYYLGK